jgi:hypothetical protein
MMKASRRLNRRSFVASVVGGASLLAGRAAAQNVRYSGVTDCDSGAQADRPSYGTGVRNQVTDQDSGPNADPRCHGRGPQNRAQGGPSGYGRYGEPASNCSDSDSGTNADPGGRGRSCGGSHTPWPRSQTPETTRHCTDSDSGAGADPVQGGRRC